MADIIKEILESLGSNKKLISDAAFEGANIVLYTKEKEFFEDNEGAIKKVVDEFKKRIELRPDPSIAWGLEKAEKEIRKLIPEDAGIAQVLFEPPRSIVTIEVERPGVAIGKQGSILKDIRTKTSWVPVIRRAPPIKCTLIDNIRSVLYQNADERKKFLNRTGHRIYDGWIRGKKNEWIRMTYLGSGRQVGRSCILLQTPESRVLLDCGVDVANEREPFPYLECPDFNINELDAVIVSHAHLDHSGLIPLLFKYGYKGPIYCTAPTRDVMALLQLDYVKIMKNEGKDTIYTSEEVKQMVMNTICLEYEEVTDITPDVRITLYNSGHILGGSLVHLHVGNGLHNIVYTGDLKCDKTHLLEGAVTKFPRVETLMIEGTYGGKANVVSSKKACEDEVRKIIQETVKKNGKILMPVLGSGRAQEILLILEEMVRTGELDKIPVYIDGMVWDITAIHTAYPDFLNNNVRKQIYHKDNNPFMSDIFKRVGSQKERMEIIEHEGSCIVLATSGMLTGGPSVEYLKHFADGKNNALIFTCYLGEGSLGKRIQNGMTDWEQGSQGGKFEVTKIALKVVTIDGFTGHADRNELMSYVSNCYPKPKKVIINHGESSRCLDLASSIHKVQRIETNAPKNLEAIRIR